MTVAKLTLPIVFACLTTFAVAQELQTPTKVDPSQSLLGINLNGPADWNSEIPFTDVFRLARTWISQRKGEAWGKGPALELDEKGWIKRLEPDCYAETPLLTIPGGRFPEGEYVCLYQGTGRVEFWNIRREVSREPGRIVFEPKSGEGGFFLRITETDPEDQIRNIRVLLPGCEETYEQEPFRPGFLERWRGFNTIRFMDWMETNGSEISTWEERPTLDRYTFTERGIPVEVMVDLCNRIGANAWFCMPHKANDEYVRQFATFVRDHLDPSLKAYIEYSNEVWNSQFPQNKHAVQKGQELGLGAKERPWEGGGMYYARRSVEIFRIWEDVFSGRERLVRVLAWQAANPWWSEHIILPQDECYKHADALAIAPYITFCIGPNTKPDADTVASWTLDQLFEHLYTYALPQSLDWITKQKAIADKFGLDLIAYEAGQHLVGVGGGENNDQMTALFQSANRDPRMGDLYTRYLDGWHQAGGELMCIFASTGRWSKWGSWGLSEFYDETEADQPKLRAVLDWNRAHGR